MTRLHRFAVALALVGLAGPATAQTVAKHATHSHHRRAHAASHTPHQAAFALAPARAGLVVAWDPESQRFGMPDPTARLALTASEQNALSRSFAGLVQVHHPDGSVSVDLQGRFQEFAVVHMGLDGKPAYRCLDDSATVRRALLEPLPAHPGLEDR